MEIQESSPIQRLNSSLPDNIGIQAKLRVGDANDSLEREADRVAEEVIAGGARSGISQDLDNVTRRKCSACTTEEDDDAKLRRKPCSNERGGAGAPVPAGLA